MFQENDNTSDNIGANSAIYAAFCERLRLAGFTSNQLMQIDDALRECGLEVVAMESVSG